jgi:hypothetical protein
MRMGNGGPEPELSVGEWLVGLASWVLADGNYEDFAVGEARDFALEFHASGLATAGQTSRRADRAGDGYEVEAAVVLAGPRLAVIDFGLSAYTELPPPGLIAGSFVRGHVDLAVDPFFYFETHGFRRDVPPLIYSWTITGMWWQTAPFVLGVRGWERDAAQRSWASIDRTDEAPPNLGGNEFLLRCRLNDSEPARPRR